MAEHSIYTTGGTVQAGGGIYLARQADAELLDLCQAGAFVYILTPRQMGKSSLMVRTAEQVSQVGSRAAMIDLTQLGVQVTAEQWYLGFLAIIEEQLELATDVVQWWQARTHLGLTQRMTQFFKEVLLVEVAEPVVIFIDEIDSTLSLDFTDDFFAAIRYLYVARAQEPVFQRLSFVLIGVATPADLIRDPKRTPFNIGQRVDLADFTLAEAMPLAAGLGLAAPHAEQVMGWVLKWTGGHPYLTQRLCGALVESRAVGASQQLSEADVDRVVGRTFLGAMSEQDNNLQFVRDMLTKRAPEPEAVLQTYRLMRRGQPVLDEEQSLVKSHLKLSGMVRREGKHLAVRNRIYAEVFNLPWVREHLPETFWQRYKPVLKWAVPLTAASVVVAVVMAGLAGEAQHQKRIAEENATEAKDQKIIADQNAKTAQQKAAEAQQQKDRALKSEATAKQALTKEQEANKQKAIALTTAETQRQRAEEQATIAETQRQRAEEQTTIAQEQTRRAETQTGIAQTQTRLAQTEKQRAEQQTTVAQLREQAARVLNLLPTATAVPGLILAMDTMEHSQSIPDVNLNLTAQSSLLSAVQVAQEVNQLPGHGDWVSSVAFSPDGRRIVSGSYDNTLRLWDAYTGQPIDQPLQGHGAWVFSVAFSPDGRRIVSGSADNTLRLWDAYTGQPIGQPLQGHGYSVSSVAFSPDGRRIVSGSYDKTLRLWDASTRQPIGQPLPGYRDSVSSVAFSPDGRRIVSGSKDRTLWLWDASTGQPIGQPLQEHGNSVSSVAFSPDGRRIVSGSKDRTLRLWDASTGRPIGQPLQGHGDSVNSVAFSPDGRRIVSGSDDRTLRLWDASTGRPIGQPLSGHGSGVNSVAFSPDGRRIVSGSKDKTLRLWDASTGQPIGQPMPGYGAIVTSVAFSPDGRRIVSGSDDRTLRLWDASTGQPIGQPLQGHGDRVNSVAFSPDSSRIVSGSDDKTLRLWDASTGQPIGQPLQGYEAIITSVAFSPDGRRIVSGSGSYDRTVRLWDASPEGWLGIACNRLQYHPLLNHPETVTTDPEFLKVAQRARAVCQQKVWRNDRPTISQSSPPQFPLIAGLADAWTSLTKLLHTITG